jgi:ATP-dependent DNA helicase PIF1
VALTQTQVDVLERCKEGANVFLTGGAGTGKSYLLKCILEEMVDMYGKQAVFVTATTGIAAVNIGGTTVHQFAGIRPGDTAAEIGDAFNQVLHLLLIAEV